MNANDEHVTQCDDVSFAIAINWRELLADA
jgi:hypothetical protein